MEKDTRHRKYNITINNPGDIWTHDEIKIALNTLQLGYYCLSDEIGVQGKTPHTHIFFASKRSAIRFSTVKGLFPTAHIEPARGSCEENRAYIQKSGKWADNPKSDTSIPDTFEEWGELPEKPGQGYRSDIAMLYEMIADGMTNAEIMAFNPCLAIHITRMDKIRQEILEARYANVWRDLDVTYIYGPTATGKTRSVMDELKYRNVYRVTDYKHPFDRYASQPALCFDEFRSSIPISEMLDYLDGYPLALPARYAPRQACYTNVYIISNIPLKNQYLNIQKGEPETYKAFLRRIHHVIEYQEKGAPIAHGSAMEYMFSTVPKWVEEAEQSEINGMPKE